MMQKPGLAPGAARVFPLRYHIHMTYWVCLLGVEDSRLLGVCVGQVRLTVGAGKDPELVSILILVEADGAHIVDVAWVKKTKLNGRTICINILLKKTLCCLHLFQ